MTDWLQTVNRGLEYIGSMQRSDGGFDGLASAEPSDFDTAHVQPTVFFTALIAECCAESDMAQAIAPRAVSYLLAHKSQGWSWNYWERNAVSGRRQGYPDDLDDTSCAISAVHAWRPELITGAVLGYVGQQLVACEQEPGGPYQTWLVPPDDLEKWYDVDIAVNANIAHMLGKLDVRVPGLETFLIDSINNDRLSSKYYIGVYPSIYFLARTAWPDVRRSLHRIVSKELKKQPLSRTALANSLLLAAACRLGYGSERTRLLAGCLISQQRKGIWPASALYVEPPVDGVAYYAGSNVLTTAFACEALTLYGQSIASTGTLRPDTNTSGPLDSIFDEVRHYAATLPGAALKHEYRQAIERISQTDTDGQISGLAERLMQDIGAHIPAATLQNLQIASINGWIAYTLYDDALDGVPGPMRISAANVALRQCEAHFHQALPHSDQFAALVQSALTTVDAANAWEQHRARAHISDGMIYLPPLPNYVRYATLAERSWGHILASSGVLLAHGFAADGPELRLWQRFFRHFLIARQLNDDAHDWQEDLTTGQLSAVVCVLLRTAGLTEQFSVVDSMDRLKTCFWHTVVLTVCADITKQLDAAEVALGRCQFINQPAYYHQLIVQLRGAVEATLTARQEALLFIRAFTQSGGSKGIIVPGMRH